MEKGSHVSYLCIAVAGHTVGAISVRKDWLRLPVSAHPGGDGMVSNSALSGGGCGGGCSHHGRADIRKSMTRPMAEL